MYCDEHEVHLVWRAFDPYDDVFPITTWPGRYVCPVCEEEAREADDEEDE